MVPRGPVRHSRVMGFFSKLREQVEAAQAAATAMAGGEPATDIPVFVRPWPQDDVDRLLAGTGSIRAIVLSKRHQVLEAGERVGAMRVKITLRPRGPEGSLGEKVTVNATLSSLTASLVEQGLDIPVERDAATGAITKVASKQLTAELSERMDEAKKRNPAWGLDEEVQGMIEVATAIVGGGKAPAPSAAPPSVSDPRRQPVDRITWEIYVAVNAQLQVHGAPNGADQVARTFGVLPGTWLAVSTVWANRIAADAELTAMYERDLAAACAVA